MAKRDAQMKSIEAAFKTVRSYRRKAIRHKWEYNGLFLAVELKKHICQRKAFPGTFVLLMAASQEKGLEPPPFLIHGLSLMLQELGEEEKRLYKLAEPYWEKWR